MMSRASTEQQGVSSMIDERSVDHTAEANCKSMVSDELQLCESGKPEDGLRNCSRDGRRKLTELSFHIASTLTRYL